MADSNITKSALASALKELMETTPFAKITVSDICAKCNMNRKSFYYHFKDKFDLVNWIYDVETYTKGVSNQQGSLEVTKALVYMDPETGKIYNLQAPKSYEENGETVPGARYYVGLFCDAEGTIPYGKNYLKTIDFNGSHSETIKYDNLPDGIYYHTLLSHCGFH